MEPARSAEDHDPVIAAGSFGIGRGGLDGKALLAWAVVGIPILWGVWVTVQKTAALF